MKISFQMGVGGRRGYRVDGTNRAGFDEVARDVRKEIIGELNKRAIKATRNSAYRLASAMSKAANREVHALRRMVTQEMIGARSVPGLAHIWSEQDFLGGLGHAFDNVGFGGSTNTRFAGAAAGFTKAKPPIGRVTWKALTARGKKRKTASGTTGHNKDRFFRNTDALVASLRGGLLETALFTTAGGIQVLVERAPNSDNVPRGQFVRGSLAVAKITVRIFPKLTATHLPYLSSGKWNAFRESALLEKFLFGDGDEFIKLRGPMHPHRIHRPMLQPLIGFFMAYRIPRALALAINKANLPKRGD